MADYTISLTADQEKAVTYNANFDGYSIQEWLENHIAGHVAAAEQSYSGVRKAALEAAYAAARLSDTKAVIEEIADSEVVVKEAEAVEVASVKRG